MRKCYLTAAARYKGLEKCHKTNRLALANRIRKYRSNPKICAYCSVPLPYKKRINKFCSRSCSASFNNPGIARNVTTGKRVKKPCLYCGSETSNKKFCNATCYSSYLWQKRVEKIKLTGELQDHRRDRQYLEETRGRKCEICGIDEWQELPVPLVLDHVNGDSDNNRLPNVRLICHNCNAQTDTFCGKNKGNGRWSKRATYRNTRYAKGLSH